ncbi:hypothetical protein PENTCL1PPCAC_6583, partial [Pristionchus entomophagus]
LLLLSSIDSSMAFYFALMNVSNKKERRRSSSRASHSSSFYETSHAFPSAPSNSFESICGSLSQGEGTPNSIVPSSTASFPPPVRTSKKVRFKPQSPTPSLSSSSPTTTRNYFLGSRRVSRLYRPLITSVFLPHHDLETTEDQFSIDSSHLSYLRERQQKESIEVQVQNDSNEYNTLIEKMEGVSSEFRDHKSTMERRKDRWNEKEEVDQGEEQWRDEEVRVNWTRKIIGQNTMSEIHFINPSFVYLQSEIDWFLSMTRQCIVY